MSENPFRSLIGDLGKQLSQNEHVDTIFPTNKVKAKRITPDSFQEIKDVSNPKRIAFVDGGDGLLEEAPNYQIIINRIYFSIFQGKKRIKPKKLKPRVEFVSYVVSTVKSEGEKKSISYDTRLYPYNQQDRQYIPEESDITSKTDATTILEQSRLFSLARRFAEWKMAKRVVEEELAAGDILIIDGSLQTIFKNEARYANSLYETALEKGIYVCGLAKTSRLITESGDPLLARISEMGDGVDFAKWYVEIAETVSSDDRGYLLGVKFHPKSRYVFRFEVLREQFNNMEKEKKNEILASISANSQDIAMPGYPYGSIDVDRFAQVRKNELNMYRGLLMAEMSQRPEWKRLQKYGFATKAHDDLNWVTS